MQSHAQQPTSHPLSTSSYIRLTLLLLLYLLITSIKSSSRAHAILQATTASIPAILFAYLARHQKDRTVTTDALISHYTFGALAWPAVHTVLYLLLSAATTYASLLARVIATHAIQLKPTMLTEAAAAIMDELGQFGAQLDTINASNTTQLEALQRELPFMSYIGTAVHYLSISNRAIADTICVVLAVRKALAAVVSSHNLAVPLGVRVLFNYAVAGALGFCTTTAFLSARLAPTEPVRLSVRTLVFVGAVGIVAFEYAAFVCFQRPKRVARAVGCAAAYVTAHVALGGLADRNDDCVWCAQMAALVVRAAVCAVVSNALRKRYVRFLAGKFE